MADAPQILFFVNDGARDLALNSIYSLLRCGVDRSLLRVMTVSEATHRYLADCGITSVQFETANGSFQNWGTAGFQELVHHKILAVRSALEDGDVLYVDADTAFLTDPVQYLDRLPVRDMWAQDDQGEKKEQFLCSGFFLMRSNERTKHFVDDWCLLHAEQVASGINPEHTDQHPFNELLKERDLDVGVLPERAFANGWVVFDQLGGQLPTDREVCLFHSNFAIGLENKIARLQHLGLWFVDEPDFQSVLCGRPVGDTHLTA